MGASGLSRKPLLDGFGRQVRDLRISITDRCNLRCVYCMPADGLTFVRRSELLTYEEIERLAQLAVERLGVDAVRLTGGEPTVRADLSELVCQLARLRTWQGDPVDLSLTTNGTTLRRQAASLRAAGLRRVNVSLDSLRPERLPRSRGGTTSTRCWTESMRRWRWVSRQ